MSDPDRTPAARPRFRPSPAQWAIVGVAASLAVARVIYSATHDLGINGSAALFVGIPAAMAIVVALSSSARSAKGQAVKAVTIMLLLTATLVLEGTICIIMAAPLFYAVALGIGAIVDAVRRRGGTAHLTLAPVVLIALLLSSEGVVGSLPRGGDAGADRIVAGTPLDVARALAEPPRFDEQLPLFLRIGFPRPVAASGSGLRIGDRRSIRFADGGVLVMEVTRSEPGLAVFETRSDSTMIGTWMHVTSATVTWQAVDAAHTEVTWSLRFDRMIDPAWYFAPWEHYGAGRMADYLIATLATPDDDA